MAIKYSGSDLSDIITIGSNLEAVINGKDGVDTFKITADQTANVDANQDATANIILEAGVSIASTSTSTFGGTQNVTLSNGAVITAHSGVTFQIGTYTVTMEELNALVVDGAYVVTGTEVNPASIEAIANEAQISATAAQDSATAAQTAADDVATLTAADAITAALEAQTAATDAQTAATAAQTAADEAAAATTVDAATTAATEAATQATTAATQATEAQTAATTATTAQTTADELASQIFVATTETANDGDTVEFTFNANGDYSETTEVSYTISGVDAADVVGGAATLTGTTTVTNGTATVAVTLRADVNNSAKTIQAFIDGTDLSASTTVGTEVVNAAMTITQSNILVDGEAGAIIPVSVGDTGSTTLTIGSSSADDSLNGKVLVSGNANATIISGSGDDKLFVEGTGNNVITMGAGGDKIFLSSGNDVVIINDGDFLDGVANDNGAVTNTIDGGAGVNTIVVSGANDLSDATALTSIQNAILATGSDVTLNIAQVSEMTSLIGNGGELTIQVDPDGTIETVDLTNVLSGTFSKITLEDDAIEFTMTAEQIENVTAFTVGATANIITDADGAEALALKGITPTIDAGDSITLEEATTQKISEDEYVSYEVNATAEEAHDQLYITDSGFATLDAAEQLIDTDGANATVATLNVTTTATAAQAVMIKTAGPADAIGSMYAVSDTATNIAAQLTTGGMGAWLNSTDISSLTITTAATIDEAKKIFKVADDVEGSNTTGALNAAVTAAALEDDDDAVIELPTYDISDSATNIFASIDANEDFVTDAETVTVSSGTFTVDQATDVVAALGTKIQDYSISDDAANVYSMSQSLRDGATDITVNNLEVATVTFTASGAHTKAQTIIFNGDTIAASSTTLESLINDIAGGTYDDYTVTNYNTTAGTVEFTAKVAGTIADIKTSDFTGTAIEGNVAAGSVSIDTIGGSTTTTVMRAERIDGFNNSGDTVYSITDSATALSGAASSVLTNAETVTVNTAATLSQAQAFVSELATDAAWTLNDTGVNLISDDAKALYLEYAGATKHTLEVTPSEALTIAESTELKAIVASTAPAYGINTLTAHAIEDTYENILATFEAEATDSLGNNADGTTVTALNDATSVTLSEATTVANVVELDTTGDIALLVTTTDITFSINDSAENIAAALATAVNGTGSLVADATSVTVNDSATATEAVTLAAINAIREGAGQSALTYTVTDSLSDMVATAAHEVQTIDFSSVGDATGSGTITVGGVGVTTILSGETPAEMATKIAAGLNGQTLTLPASGGAVVAVADGAVVTVVFVSETTQEAEITVTDSSNIITEASLVYAEVAKGGSNAHLTSATSLTVAPETTDTVTDGSVVDLTEAAIVATLNTDLTAANKATLDYSVSDDKAALSVATQELLDNAVAVELVDTAANIAAYDAITTEAVVATWDAINSKAVLENAGTAVSTNGDYYTAATSITLAKNISSLTTTLTQAEAMAAYKTFNDLDNGSKVVLNQIATSADEALNVTVADTNYTAAEKTATLDQANEVTITGHATIHTIDFTAAVKVTIAGDIMIGKDTQIAAAVALNDTPDLIASKVAAAINDQTIDDTDSNDTDAPIYATSNGNVVTITILHGETNADGVIDIASDGTTAVSGTLVTASTITQAEDDLVSVEEVEGVLSLAGGDVSITASLSDTVENLISNAAVLEVLENASANYVIATDTATAAQYQTLVDMMQTAELLPEDTTAEDVDDILNVDISDSITNIQDASVELLSTLGDEAAGENVVTLTAGTEVSLSVAQASELALSSDKLVDVEYGSSNADASFELVDTIDNLINDIDFEGNASGNGVDTANVLDLSAVLTSATNIIATGGATVTDELPDANDASYIEYLEVLIDNTNFDKVNSTYSLESAATLLASSNVDDAVINATSITVTGAATAAQADDIYANNTNVTFEEIDSANFNEFFSIEDGVASFGGTVAVNGANLEADTAEAILAAAGNVLDLENDTLTVEEAQAITTLLGESATVTYALSDTAVNLAAAGDILANAVSITAAEDADTDATESTNVTVAQAQAIITGANSETDIFTMDLSDTAANIAAASDDVYTLADSITLTDTATMAEAVAIETADEDNATHGVNIDVVDSAANVAANADESTTFVIGASDTITLNTTATLAEANTIQAYDTGAAIKTLDNVTDSTANDTDSTTGIALADTAANLLDAVNVDGFDDAISIEITGAVNVSKVIQVADAAQNSAKYSSDAEALAVMNYNIDEKQAYFIDAMTNSSDTNALIAGADSVTIDSATTVELVSHAGSNYLTGDLTTLQALPEALLAVGYVANDTIANLNADGAVEFVAAANSQTYIVSDEAANITATPSFASASKEVHVTDSVDTTTLASIQSAVGAKLSTVSEVSGSATDIAGANLDDQIIATVTITDDSITINQYTAAFVTSETLTADTTLVYNLNDTETNIFGSNDEFNTNALNTVTNAAAVTITEDLNVVQAGLVYDANSNVTMDIIDAKGAFDVLSEESFNIDDIEQAQIDAINAATNVSLSASQKITVAQAEALIAVSGFDGVYTLADKADKLAAADSTLLANAVSIEFDTDTATVAEATTLSVLSNFVNKIGADAAYKDMKIDDTAANLANASADLLDNVKEIDINTDDENEFVTTAQAELLKAHIDNSAVVGLDTDAYKIDDTYANIIAGDSATVKYASVITSDDTLTLAQAQEIITMANPTVANTTTTSFNFDLSDTRSNLQKATTAEAAYADTVVVSDDITAGQAAIINDLYDGANQTGTPNANAAEISFGKVTGTHAELTSAIVDQATSVALTTEPTISELTNVAGTAFLNYASDKLVDGYVVKDTVAELANAAENNTFSREILTSATSVKLSGTAASDNDMTIAASTVIIGLGNFAGEYDIADTATEVATAASTLINGATTVTVEFKSDVDEVFDARSYTTNVILDMNAASTEDTVQLSSAATKEAMTQAIDVAAGVDSLDFGYITGSGFTSNESGAETIEVTYDTNKVVYIDGLGNFEIEDVYYMIGGSADDTLNGVTFLTDADDTVNTDNLVIYGLDGADTITGGAGADTLVGGAGNDTITGGAGADTITIGTGNNVIVIAEGDSTGAAADTAIGFDVLNGFVVANDTIQITDGASVAAAGNIDVTVNAAIDTTSTIAETLALVTGAADTSFDGTVLVNYITASGGSGASTAMNAAAGGTVAGYIVIDENANGDWDDNVDTIIAVTGTVTGTISEADFTAIA